MNQDVLATLLRGNTALGAPALESLILNANESINVYGAVALDARGADARCSGWCWRAGHLRLWRGGRHGHHRRRRIHLGGRDRRGPQRHQCRRHQAAGARRRHAGPARARQAERRGRHDPAGVLAVSAAERSGDGRAPAAGLFLRDPGRRQDDRGSGPGRAVGLSRTGRLQRTGRLALSRRRPADPHAAPDRRGRFGDDGQGRRRAVCRRHRRGRGRARRAGRHHQPGRPQRFARHDGGAAFGQAVDQGRRQHRAGRGFAHRPGRPRGASVRPAALQLGRRPGIAEHGWRYHAGQGRAHRRVGAQQPRRPRAGHRAGRLGGPHRPGRHLARHGLRPL